MPTPCIGEYELSTKSECLRHLLTTFGTKILKFRQNSRGLLQEKIRMTSFHFFPEEAIANFVETLQNV
jgi:hypothetical protein